MFKEPEGQMRMMSCQIVNVNRGTESIRRNQIEILKLKSIINEMLNSLEGFHSVLNRKKNEAENLKIDW